MRFTGQTFTTHDDLLADLARARARGFAYDDEERYEGVRCVAAAVRDHTGRTVAAMGISGPTSRLTREKLPALTTEVCAATEALSAQLGYRHATATTAARADVPAAS